jgi:hypothetical protein
MHKPTDHQTCCAGFSDAAGVLMYPFSSERCVTRFRRFSLREVRHVVDRSWQSLTNHCNNATDGPVDIRNLLFEKQRLPGPIYPDCSRRFIASKRHFLQ